MEALRSGPKWSAVRAFGGVKYFNISYAILLLVPLLYELHSHIRWPSSLPFPDTVRFLYGASLFYAIGIACYQYFCPSDIKRFGHVDEYVEAQYDLYLRANPHHRLNIVLTHLDPKVDGEVQTTILTKKEDIQKLHGGERIAAQAELDALLQALHPDAVQRFLVKQYEKNDLIRPVARWCSFVLYLVGTAIVLWLLARRSYALLWTW
jgi:hypothetical protein